MASGGSDGKASSWNAGDLGLHPWVRKIPWRRKWQSTPALLPGKLHGWRSLIGYSPWGCKESDTTERLSPVLSCPGGSDGKESACNAGKLDLILGWGEPLEKGMATHASILAWRNPMDRRAWWAVAQWIGKSWTQLTN